MPWLMQSSTRTSSFFMNILMTGAGLRHVGENWICEVMRISWQPSCEVSNYCGEFRVRQSFELNLHSVVYDLPHEAFVV